MKKIIRLTESDLTRIVKRIINEERKVTIDKPKDYDNFQKNCKTKNSGLFKRLGSNIHLECVKESGTFFHPKSNNVLILKNVVDYPEIGKTGPWKLVGNKIELKSTL
jgi:hypothetical protein